MWSNSNPWRWIKWQITQNPNLAHVKKKNPNFFLPLLSRLNKTHNLNTKYRFHAIFLSELYDYCTIMQNNIVCGCLILIYKIPNWNWQCYCRFQCNLSLNKCIKLKSPLCNIFYFFIYFCRKCKSQKLTQKGSKQKCYKYKKFYNFFHNI